MGCGSEGTGKATASAKDFVPRSVLEDRLEATASELRELREESTSSRRAFDLQLLQRQISRQNTAHANKDHLDGMKATLRSTLSLHFSAFLGLSRLLAGRSMGKAALLRVVLSSWR